MSRLSLWHEYRSGAGSSERSPGRAPRAPAPAESSHDGTGSAVTTRHRPGLFQPDRCSRAILAQINFTISQLHSQWGKGKKTINNHGCVCVANGTEAASRGRDGAPGAQAHCSGDTAFVSGAAQPAWSSSSTRGEGSSCTSTPCTAATASHPRIRCLLKIHGAHVWHFFPNMSLPAMIKGFVASQCKVSAWIAD